MEALVWGCPALSLRASQIKVARTRRLGAKSSLDCIGEVWLHHFTQLHYPIDQLMYLYRCVLTNISTAQNAGYLYPNFWLRAIQNSRLGQAKPLRTTVCQQRQPRFWRVVGHLYSAYNISGAIIFIQDAVY